VRDRRADRRDAAQFACFDQRGDHGPILSAVIRSGESAFLRLRAIGRIDRSTVLESIFDPAVVEEAREAAPVRARVANDLGELALLTDEGEPRFELCEKRTRPFVADGAPFVRLAAADVGLDPIERGDALQRLGFGEASETKRS